MRCGRKQSEALLDPGKADLVAETADGVVELVNELTPGRARGMTHPATTGIDRVRATAEALGNEAANRFRVLFEAAAHDGDTDRAANETYRLSPDTHACPQLDLTEPGWNLHFHGADDTLAIGSDLAGRLNAQRRFCSPQCQSRVKAAAHRARKAAS
jgi:hypothetical protein